MINNHIFRFTFFLFLLIPLVYGGVSRDLPKQVLLGDEISELINISVGNASYVKIVEPVNEKLEFVSPLRYLIIDKVEGNEIYDYKYISREIYLQKGETLILEHVFRPKGLGIVYFFPIFVSEGNLSYENEGRDVMVKCIPDGKCSQGENFINCQDCKENSLDGICNSKQDGVCDPDCLSGDPDCNSYCGDASCDESKENPINCKSDCGENTKESHNVKFYYLNLRIDNKKVNLKNISVLTGDLYKRNFLNSILKFRLKSENSIIEIFNKSINLNKNNELFVKIPYSQMAVAIDIYSGKRLLLNIDLSQYSHYCGDGTCSEDESFCEVDCGQKETGNYQWIIYLVIALILVIGIFIFFKQKNSLKND